MWLFALFQADYSGYFEGPLQLRIFTLSQCDHAENQREQCDGLAQTHDGDVLREALSCFGQSVRTGGTASPG